MFIFYRDSRCSCGLSQLWCGYGANSQRQCAGCSIHSSSMIFSPIANSLPVPAWLATLRPPSASIASEEASEASSSSTLGLEFSHDPWQVPKLPKIAEAHGMGAFRLHKPWFMPQLTWVPHEIRLDLWLHFWNLIWIKMVKNDSGFVRL